MSKFLFYAGHGCLIGYYSGKILAYTTRSKSCRRCQAGQTKKSHDCRENFSGTSKAMEPDMAMELITQNPIFEKLGVFCGRLVMDDDTTTIDSLRRVCKHLIVKWSDKNHACKNFKKALYALKLDSNLIDYLYKLFVAAIDCNKGDVHGLKTALTAIVPHCFGDHTLCNWHSEKNNYVYKNIPNNKPLDNPQVRITLDDLFLKYITNVDKLAAAASTQANESFNNTMISKCPKSKHFSGSESFNFRMAACVCQKNLGFGYVDKIFEDLQLTPVKSNHYRALKEKQKVKKRLFANSLAGKQRRKLNKTKKSQKEKNLEMREGVSYQSNIGIDSVAENPDDLEILAVPILTSDEIENYKIVLFDIETTGLKAADQIVQVNIHSCGHGKMIVYQCILILDCRFLRRLIFQCLRSSFKAFQSRSNSSYRHDNERRAIVPAWQFDRNSFF